MNTLTDAIEVARAAVAEVGLAARFSRKSDGGITGDVLGDLTPDNDAFRLAYRAMLLGVMAEQGLSATTKCILCSPRSSGRNRRCITVAEALQGITCGR